MADVVETKPAWQSKTLWVNAIMGVLALALPEAQQFIVEHPEMFSLFWTVVNIVLRFVTKDKVVIS